MSLLKVCRHNPSAFLPTYATERSAGLDLYACMDSDFWIHPGKRKLISTGLILEIPEGFEGQIRPRSGMAFNAGVTVLNAPGTIDSDYRGHVCVILVNHGERDFQVRHGDRIAQLVIAPVARIAVEEVASHSLTYTVRADGGFGSTGK